MAVRKLKIALIGPAVPYRGGIAQYNTQLYKALNGRADAELISFKRMYPKWLYPGKFDKEPNYRSEADKSIKYLIDVYWPFSLKKTTDKITASKTDVALITWWTLFWQPGLAYVARRLRGRGIKVIYICHNVFDHDANKLVRAMSKVMLGQADGYVVHASEEEDKLKELYSGRPILNTGSLPIYDNYPKARGTLKKRGRLELLFFGFIRPYKGLDTFIDALEQLDDKEVFPTIVGESWTDDLEKELLAKKIPNLELNLTYVDDRQAAKYFARADVVVLPYKSATGSGVAALAYFYKKPVLGTKVGGLKDVVVEGKTGWLVNPGAPRELAETITKLDRQKAGSTEEAIYDFCKQHSWDRLAQQICGFSRNLRQ